jgi:DNA topoisomerase III
MKTARSNALHDLLKKHFGFENFRPYQEEVCRAVSQGKSALLVMPTGAGKSLCYQIPALARGGTCLIVSPLVALIEDQVSKLIAWGLKAERIHSGRDRSESRLVCEMYLKGELDFLFIAPERLAVPGFAEMLARKPLSLIAIDEAHCISQWGHDFRPEYRMLGARLPMLQTSGQTPVIALTATATPTVQKDILSQLQLGAAATFIHGFRRDNISISVSEVSKSDRPEQITKILSDEKRLPAIVYASTRKSAEELAKHLSSNFKVSLYHAGLTKEDREQKQLEFLKGDSSIMVATIAFGMGIDKPNVRTVVHAALPTSLEGYYQEIGRAGRDGLASTAALMWSYADRKMHEFLFEKNYPSLEILTSLVSIVQKNKPSQKPLSREALKLEAKKDADLLDSAIEKLWIHGALRVDMDDNVHLGAAKNWQQSYIKQCEHRKEQMQLIASFAETRDCRMLHLTRHFGDKKDSGKPCGMCDACAPDLSSFRPPNAAEILELSSIYKLIDQREGQSLGRIHREGAPKLDRKVFELFATALMRANYIEIEERSFEKDGKSIKYRSAYPIASAFKESDLAMRVKIPVNLGKSHTRKTKNTKVSSAPTQKISSPATLATVNRLKEWRLQEAKSRRTPAFTILTDKCLMGIAAANPANSMELQSVPGMGPKLVERYGKALLDLVRS